MSLFIFSCVMLASAGSRDIIHVLIVLAVIGLCLWALRFIPMEKPFPEIIKVVALIATALWLLNHFGLI